MAYNHEALPGQAEALARFDDFGVPSLDAFRFDTNAPYDIASAVDTLFLSRIDVNEHEPIKHPAVSVVSYEPGESFAIFSHLSLPARRILIGKARLVYNAANPIGGVIVEATKDNAYIQF